MTNTLTTLVFAGLLCIGVGSPATAVDDYGDLLKRIPPNANMLFLVDAEAIRSKGTKASRREVRDLVTQAKSWPLVAPWGPQKIVMASEVDIQHMAPVWQMAAMSLAKSPNMKSIAEFQNGVEDKLLDQEVVWLREACVLRTGENELTFVSPLNRQSATRLLRNMAAGESPSLSPYLAEVANFASKSKAEMVMAIDLESVFRIQEVEAAVKASDLLMDLKPNPSSILAGVRGITIRCQITGEQASSIHVDFAESVAPLKSVARPLLMGAFAKMGAMLPEFKEWTVETHEKSISLSGQLTPTGLARLMSLSSIGLKAAKTSAAVANAKPAEPVKPEAAPKEAGVDQVAEKPKLNRATQFYLQDIEEKLQDLRDTRYNNTLNQAALWIKNYSSNIENQSTKDVDPKAVEYGEYVAAALKDIVYQFYASDASVITRSRAAQPVWGDTRITAVPIQRYNYGGQYRFRYAPMVERNLNIGGAIQERRQIAADEVQNANKVAMDIMNEIAGASQAMKKYLKEKYRE